MRVIIGMTVVATLAGCTGERAGVFNGPGLFGGRAEINNATPANPVSTAPTQLVPNPVVQTPLDPVVDPVSAPPPGSIGAPDPFDSGVVNPDEDGGPAASAPASDGRLGSTVATLGDPGEEGFWVKTNLVSAPTQGRVVYVSSGRSVQVKLIPLDGGGGSQISMAAMRLLDAPLTGLPELVVYGS